MPPANPTTDTDETADLARLADELRPRGCKTILVTGDGRLPCLDVINPDAAVCSERIYAQADSFWWPWACVIAPRDQPAAAAQIIASTLAVTGTGTRDSAAHRPR